MCTVYAMSHHKTMNTVLKTEQCRVNVADQALLQNISSFGHIYVNSKI